MVSDFYFSTQETGGGCTYFEVVLEAYPLFLRVFLAPRLYVTIQVLNRVLASSVRLDSEGHQICLVTFSISDRVRNAHEGRD